MDRNQADVVTLARALIACNSITPARGQVFDVLDDALQSIGFTVDRFVAGDDRVENLLAIRGDGGRHLAFAGHLDVVPPGADWSADPWSGDVRGGMIYGRGAVDMKGAVAAFVAAAACVEPKGTLSFIITGDEEGPAIHGTRSLIERMQARGVKPDVCLVGEPTSQERLGDMVKIGRRGSVNIWIDVRGRQGHVAYPNLADNPIPRLIAILSAIDRITLDEGNNWFQPSNIEVTDLTVGNLAHNVIPARAGCRLSIRFNNEQTGSALIERIEHIAKTLAPDVIVTGQISGEAFLTPPGAWSSVISAAITQATGLTATLSTTGGTSDARFLSTLCPTVEFGLVNATMHKVDEAVAIADLHMLTDIYAGIINRALA